MDSKLLGCGSELLKAERLGIGDLTAPSLQRTFGGVMGDIVSLGIVMDSKLLARGSQDLRCGYTALAT